MNEGSGKMIIYQTPDGQTTIELSLEKDRGMVGSLLNTANLDGPRGSRMKISAHNQLLLAHIGSIHIFVP